MMTIYQMYFGPGYTEQLVINVAKLKLTIVATVDGNQSPEAGETHDRAIMGLVINYLLESLREAKASG